MLGVADKSSAADNNEALILSQSNSLNVSVICLGWFRMVLCVPVALLVCFGGVVVKIVYTLHVCIKQPIPIRRAVIASVPNACRVYVVNRHVCGDRFFSVEWFHGVSASLKCSEIVDHGAISVDVFQCASDDSVAASLIEVEHAIGCVRACGKALAFLCCLPEGVLSDDVESLEP